jgi:hypothetical protein
VPPTVRIRGRRTRSNSSSVQSLSTTLR